MYALTITKKITLKSQISKANFTQTVFLIDLPRIPRGRERLKDSELTHFAKELIYFCKKKGYPANILDALHCIDYSKTTHLTFVHSIGGSHTGDDWKRTGYPGLAAAVRALGLQSGKGLMVDYVVCTRPYLAQASFGGSCALSANGITYGRGVSGAFWYTR